VTFNGLLWLFFHGSDTGGDAWVANSADGVRWDYHKLPAEVLPETGLTPIVFKNRIFVFFRPNGDDIRVFSTADGMTWSKPVSIFATEAGKSSSGAVPVVHEQRLYACFFGATPNRRIHLRSSADGVRWDSAVDVTDRTGVTAADGPAPVTHGGKLWIFCRMNGGDKTTLAAATLDRAGTWQKVSLTDLVGAKTSAEPVPVVYRGGLLLFFVGAANETGNLYTCTLSANGTWGPGELVPAVTEVRTRKPPAPVALGEHLYVFFRGRDDDKNINVFLYDKPARYVRLTTGTLRDAADALLVAATDDRVVIAYRSTGHDRKALASFAMPDQRWWSTRARDIMINFRELPGQATPAKIPVTPAPAGGLRTLAAYRDWLLVTTDRVPGSLVAIRRDGGTVPVTTPLSVDGHTGCAGAQVIGDFLVVALNSATAGLGVVYDLTPLRTGAQPLLLHHRLTFPEPVTGVGVTDSGSGAARHYVVALYVRGQLFAYRSTLPLPLNDPGCAFAPSFSCAVPNDSAIAAPLMADQFGRLYATLLHTGADGINWADVYEFSSTVVHAAHILHVRAPFDPGATFGHGAGMRLLTPALTTLYAIRAASAGTLAYEHLGPDPG
jgi:hypothetical protein